MELFLDYPLSTLFVLGVVLFVVLKIARRATRTSGKRKCSRCGLVHPHDAKFCRVCGQAL